MSKALGLPRLSEKVSLKGSGTSCGQGGGGFQGPSVTGYLRLALVFAWGGGGAQRGKILIAIFRGVFASTNKIFISAVGLGTRLSFHIYK